jgi:DNA-binding transcriptional LysR family regulator
MVLSPAGVQFLSYARRILSLAEEAKQALHPTTPGGSLRLGAMEATAASRLPPLLTRFQQQCPQVDVTLSTRPTRQLTEGYSPPPSMPRWSACRQGRMANRHARPGWNLSRCFRKP